MKSKVFISIFVFCFLFSVLPGTGLALSDLDKARVSFLKEDYQGCIEICENILAQDQYLKDLAEVYYLLGLSYLKTDNFLRSYDVFEIVIKEFKDSAFREEASIAQADIYFLKEDYRAALERYTAILKNSPQSRLRPLLYFRLAQVNLKNGSWQEAQKFLDKLSTEFPLSLEKRLSRNISSQDFYFTIQVGAFSKQINAENLCKKLNEEGYPAFIQETDASTVKTYRVRVGKLESRFAAEETAKKLTAEGYPANILP